jgi:hypothetical protein
LVQGRLASPELQLINASSFSYNCLKQNSIKNNDIFEILKGNCVLYKLSQMREKEVSD